ncbi:MAG: CBS domain-containing protein [Puniceicoccaceae bacterium]|nr:MAG: CBS domain-containing protein [Puniceicoccaceae bacterium]
MQTPVSDILAHKGATVFSTTPEATVRQAVHTMNEHKVGALLVMQENKPVGMFTERDVMVRVVDAGRDPETTRVREVMTSNLLTIRPTLSVEGAMKLITEKRRRHLPVVDDDGKLLGMISIGDVNRWVVRESESYIDNLYSYITSSYPS